LKFEIENRKTVFDRLYVNNKKKFSKPKINHHLKMTNSYGYDE